MSKLETVITQHAMLRCLIHAQFGFARVSSVRFGSALFGSDLTEPKRTEPNKAELRMEAAPCWQLEPTLTEAG